MITFVSNLNLVGFEPTSKQNFNTLLFTVRATIQIRLTENSSKQSKKNSNSKSNLQTVKSTGIRTKSLANFSTFFLENITPPNYYG
jgi:hypothetical protein